MLHSIRKFSTTRSAKVITFLIIMPFLFWGMGDVFLKGNKNIIAEINKEKILVNDFVNYINSFNLDKNKYKDDLDRFVDNALQQFVSKKLLQMESEKLGINISEKSLAKIIKNEKTFMDNNKFSRTKYEKFLISSNLSPANFEQNLKNQEINRMLYDFIGGGISSSEYMVNKIYNYENQSREVKVINLNDVYKKKIDSSSKAIKDYIDNNKDKFTKKFKSFKFIELNPQNLTGQNEFTNLFFENIDNIEDQISSSENINFIENEYDLKINTSEYFDENGNNIQLKKTTQFNKNLINKIFSLNIENSAALINEENKFFAVKLDNEKDFLLDIESSLVKELIKKSILRDQVFKGNILYAKEINEKKFNKNKFLSIAKKNGVNIENVLIKNLKDYSKFDKQMLNQVYAISKNDYGIIADNTWTKSFLIYVDNIISKKITKNDSNYNDYLLKSNFQIQKDIYTSYDMYLEKNYKVKINSQTLERVKNFFR